MLELPSSSESQDEDELEEELEDNKSIAVESEEAEDSSSPLLCVANPDNRWVSLEWFDTPCEKE